jgi:uncharacterized protein YndB with AHSA1/START domain
MRTGTSGEQRITMTRVFDAPREVVWRAWTDASHLARWWGPHDFTNPVCEADVRPGGELRIEMHGPNGARFATTGRFYEVAAPERLVFSTGLVDRDGKLLIEEMNTVTLVEEGGRTTLTLDARVVNPSEQTARRLRGVEHGWGESLEKLTAALPAQRG